MAVVASILPSALVEAVQSFGCIATTTQTNQLSKPRLAAPLDLIINEQVCYHGIENAQ